MLFGCRLYDRKSLLRCSSLEVAHHRGTSCDLSGIHRGPKQLQPKTGVSFLTSLPRRPLRSFRSAYPADRTWVYAVLTTSSASRPTVASASILANTCVGLTDLFSILTCGNPCTQCGRDAAAILVPAFRPAYLFCFRRRYAMNYGRCRSRKRPNSGTEPSEGMKNWGLKWGPFLRPPRSFGLRILPFLFPFESSSGHHLSVRRHS